MTTQTQTTHRPLQGEADALRLNQLLIDSFAIIGREFNWETRRWEGSFYRMTDTERTDPTYGAGAHIWETGAGELVGAAIPDSHGPGDLALQIHPHYRALEDEILAWAEEHIAETTEDGQRTLKTWVFDWDTERQERLTRRGYIRNPEWFWHSRRRRISDPVDLRPVPEGYTIRSVQPCEADVLGWVHCTNLVFGNTFEPAYHRNFQRYSPSHNYDLHIIAEAPDGSFVAFAGLTVDTANRNAVFEPVGTHPDHRRKGLARQVMSEGLRRLQTLGTADVVYVMNWGPAGSGHLYAAMGLEHYTTTFAWVKTF
jgi:mycothiol synthase